MFKINVKAKNKSLTSLKSALPCYGFSENRFFESHCTRHKDNIIFDFGLKHKLKTFDIISTTEKSNFIISKIKNFETPYNEILADFESYRRIQINNELLRLFKEKFNLKSFVKGRVLNNTKRGFSIGVCGLVGFLSINNVVKLNKDKTILLYIESMNTNQGIINFSQKNIHKKTHKTLLKLASKIVFVYESNLNK